MSEPTQNQKAQSKQVVLSVAQALIAYRAKADELVKNYSDMALQLDSHVERLSQEIAAQKEEIARLKDTIAKLQVPPEQEPSE